MSMSAWLKKETGLVWNEVSHFYVKNWLMGHLMFSDCYCVLYNGSFFHPQQSGEFYIPENDLVLHDPEKFSKVLRDTKQIITDNLPAVSFNLDLMPEIILPAQMINLEHKMQRVLLTLKFSGQLSLKKVVKSLVNISFSMYKGLADATINQCFNNINLDYKYSQNKFVINGSFLGDFYSDSCSVGSNSITTTMSPKPISKIIDGWQISGHISFVATGVFEDHDDTNYLSRIENAVKSVMYTDPNDPNDSNGWNNPNSWNNPHGWYRSNGLISTFLSGPNVLIYYA